MGPRGSAKQVFTDFEDNNGWGSVGLATLVGLLSPITTLIGADSVCHLSEELRDASYTLPWCMITTASINYVLGFIMTITFMFTVGDVESALKTATGQPYVQVILNATQSRGATIVLTATMALLLLFCAINQVTTSSRQLFAFARDNGLPYSEFLSYVSHFVSRTLI
jgi:amino acid transporter